MSIGRTLADAEARLAEVRRGRPARDFFARYIEGREAADYARLLARAGLLLRRPNAGHAWWGDARLELRGGSVRLAEPPLFATPSYVAGLDVGDEILQVGGNRVASPDAAHAAIRRQRPGDVVAVVFVDRSGSERKANLTLGEDPQLELVPVETTGGSLTPAQKIFRERWLK